MAATASRFLKFTLIHGLPFGFVMAALLLATRYFFEYLDNNASGMARSIELIPTYILIAIGAGIIRGVVLWLFRREDYGY